MFQNTLRFFAVLMLVLPMTMTAANFTATPAHLTANQIVDKNVAARGGLAAWRAVHSMTMSGNMDAGKGVQLPFLLQMMRPRKTRLELQFDGKTAVQVYDGANGWKLRPFLGHNDAEPYTPEEIRLASMQSDLDGLLIDHAAKGTKVELDGTEKVKDRDTFKLKVTLQGERICHVWVDAQTFLEVKTDGSRRMDGKMRVVETYFRDYRPANGLVVPYTLETSVDGVKGTEKILIQSFAVNPELADSRFSKP